MIPSPTPNAQYGNVPNSLLGECDCTFGLVNPPAPNKAVPLYESRVNQFMRGELTHCECKLGQQYKKYLMGKAVGYKSTPDQAEEERRAAIWKNAGVPPMYARMTLKGYIDLGLQDKGKTEAINALLSVRDEGQYNGKFGLLLWGKPGVGKTGALSPLFVHFLREGRSGLWIQYSELMARLRDFESEDNKRVMEIAKRVEYLFIDDIGDPGAEKSASDYARDCVFRIIDHRKNNGLPILGTSNLGLTGLGEQFHERIAQRLQETCAVIEVKGTVLRK